MLNALTLWLIEATTFIEAPRRFGELMDVNANMMLVVEGDRPLGEPNGRLGATSFSW